MNLNYFYIFSKYSIWILTGKFTIKIAALIVQTVGTGCACRPIGNNRVAQLDQRIIELKKQKRGHEYDSVGRFKLKTDIGVLSNTKMDCLS